MLTGNLGTRAWCAWWYHMGCKDFECRMATKWMHHWNSSTCSYFLPWDKITLALAEICLLFWKKSLLHSTIAMGLTGGFLQFWFALHFFMLESEWSMMNGNCQVRIPHANTAEINMSLERLCSWSNNLWFEFECTMVQLSWQKVALVCWNTFSVPLRALSWNSHFTNKNVHAF